MKAKPYLEVTLAAVFAALTIGTILWPAWIESLTGLEPDGGSGALERLLVALFAIITVVALTRSQRYFRRARVESTG
jgi:xanthine/uracil permease